MNLCNLSLSTEVGLWLQNKEAEEMTPKTNTSEAFFTVPPDSIWPLVAMLDGGVAGLQLSMIETDDAFEELL